MGELFQHPKQKEGLSEMDCTKSVIFYFLLELFDSMDDYVKVWHMSLPRVLGNVRSYKATHTDVSMIVKYVKQAINKYRCPITITQLAKHSLQIVRKCYFI